LSSQRGETEGNLKIESQIKEKGKEGVPGIEKVPKKENRGGSKGKRLRKIKICVAEGAST